MNESFSTYLFNKMPVIGIMRNIPGEHIDVIAKTYAESGLTCLEVTMNSPGAEKHIAALARLYGGILNIGAGTVCSVNDLEKAIAAGAQFIVTPIINEEVIKICVNKKIPIIPGAYTPSEIYTAWSLGAMMVKLFPAGDIKPGYIKEVLAPLDFIEILPTGGIGLENFTAYLANGATGVGIGGQFFPKDIISRQDWPALAAIYSQFVKKYNDFKESGHPN
jgi:2-dehydro-3-deoxyphosphogluconate aldolase / (4S)-4-hydroxy-2-oxoglutarate aldolase